MEDEWRLVKINSKDTRYRFGIKDSLTREHGIPNVLLGYSYGNTISWHLQLPYNAIIPPYFNGDISAG